MLINLNKVGQLPYPQLTFLTGGFIFTDDCRVGGGGRRCAECGGALKDPLGGAPAVEEKLTERSLAREVSSLACSSNRIEYCSAMMLRGRANA